MKKILQSLADGSTELLDVPAPSAGSGRVLIETRVSLVSAGTERMLVEFGRAGWLSKARQQPDKVRMVLDKVRTDGIAATYDAVRSKLDQPIPLGYCNVGRVIELGRGVRNLTVGDRVVSNGHHAEIVAVPQNLCVRIPDAVDDEQASFTVLAAIGLQGIRLAAPTAGECVAVIGLGLIGLLTVQMLRAQGCRVLGIDTNPDRLRLAQAFGAEVAEAGGDVLGHAQAFSRGRGIDAVLITAATKSNAPIEQAAQMSRKRGRIVLVGVTGLSLSRADFYEKELSFQVSCSYGPGRYDANYEEGGIDYPVGFVRWTEQRNFEAVLDLMADGRINIAALVSHRFKLDDAAQAYDLLASNEPSLGILLDYGEADPARLATTIDLPARHAAGNGRMTFIGAGNYASRTLIPAFLKAGAIPAQLVSNNGTTAAFFGRKFGFETAESDTIAAIAAPDSHAVVIATRHDTHAALVTEALRSGKHVFCEKPLCLTHEELETITAAHAAAPNRMVMVGFNRRFSPLVQTMKRLLDAVQEPKAFVMTINAGDIPAEHWAQDPKLGGGRILGEACHFIDLLRHLAGAPIDAIDAICFGPGAAGAISDDKAIITLRFADGSIGAVNYLANGHRTVAKERLEVFAAGGVLLLDNFRTLQAHGWRGFKSQSLRRQDKGAEQCAAAFVAAVKEGSACPIPWDETVEVAARTIDAANRLR